MSHPDPTREYGEHPEERSSGKKKVTLKSLKGLMHTKHFGAKHGARHEKAKSKALKKKRGESTFPF